MIPIFFLQIENFANCKRILQTVRAKESRMSMKSKKKKKKERNKSEMKDEVNTCVFT